MNENPDNEPRPNLWQDTVDCWHRLPNKAFFFVLLAAWLALFQFLGNAILGYVHTSSLFSWMIGAYNSPSADDGHGNFIPFLVVGLFWWKRRELLAQPLKPWWPGLLILAAALALHVAGYAFQQPYLSIAALFAGIYGLMGLAWGTAWLRNSLFPFFLFMFSVPLGQRAEFITFPLRQLVSWLSEQVAHWVLGIGVIRAGTQLFDPSGSYGFDVQAPCSGMRSLIAIFLLATIYGFFIFRSPWKRLLLMALALPFAVLGNLARMLLIIVAAELGGQPWGNYVHEGGPLGIISLVPYLPAMAGLLLVGRWLENRELKKSRP
jgi:exosortase